MSSNEQRLENPFWVNVVAPNVSWYQNDKSWTFVFRPKVATLTNNQRKKTFFCHGKGNNVLSLDPNEQSFDGNEDPSEEFETKLFRTKTFRKMAQVPRLVLV